VLVKGIRPGPCFAIAKDVKIQFEFNPVVVRSYRLIVMIPQLRCRDFNDEKKDAEIRFGASGDACTSLRPGQLLRTVHHLVSR